MLGLLSTRSNRVGNDWHKLTQRRQPWHRSNTRSSSALSAFSSQNSSFFQSSGCRVGASIPPSRMGFLASGIVFRRGVQLLSFLQERLEKDSCSRREFTRPRPPLRTGEGAEDQPSSLSALVKRLACERSALARVSNQSAISLKPSSRASLAMPGYMSEYSWVSPAIAALRFCRVSPMGSPVAGSPTASRYSRCP